MPTPPAANRYIFDYFYNSLYDDYWYGSSFIANGCYVIMSIAL